MIYLLSGNIRTGKTTAIMNWSKDRNDTGGFLSPDHNQLRVLKNIVTEEIVPFEAKDSTVEDLTEIGKFRFYTSAFEEASGWVWDHINRDLKKFIIVDEIGKLELKDKGFHSFFKKLLREKDVLTLIVLVRSSLLDQVIEKYDLQSAIVLDKINLHNLG